MGPKSNAIDNASFVVSGVKDFDGVYECVCLMREMNGQTDRPNKTCVKMPKRKILITKTLNQNPE